MATRIREYLDRSGLSPFGRWRSRLDTATRAEVDDRLERARAGNLGNWRAAGSGVRELRIFHGPGLRVYFGLDGDDLILLLGGDKGSQRRDIPRALEFWVDYKVRRKEA